MKTHWVAQTHCKDALGSADALRRRIGYLKDHGGYYPDTGVILVISEVKLLVTVSQVQFLDFDT